MGKKMTAASHFYIGVLIIMHTHFYPLHAFSIFRNLIYTVVYIHDNGKIIDEIVEHDNNSVMSTTNMAYGTNCPVIVDSKYDGIVLLPERSCSTTTTLEEGGGKGKK